MRLGEIIRAYRLHREISLRDCAKEMGISAPTLMRIEHGKDFDAKTLRAIFSWLTA